MVSVDKQLIDRRMVCSAVTVSWLASVWRHWSTRVPWLRWRWSATSWTEDCRRIGECRPADGACLCLSLDASSAPHADAATASAASPKQPFPVNKRVCSRVHYMGQWSGTMGTLASQADIGVWVQEPGALAEVRGYYPRKNFETKCKFLQPSAFLAFLNTQTVVTPFPGVPAAFQQFPRNDPCIGWSDAIQLRIKPSRHIGGIFVRPTFKSQNAESAYNNSILARR